MAEKGTITDKQENNFDHLQGFIKSIFVDVYDDDMNASSISADFYT